MIYITGDTHGRTDAAKLDNKYNPMFSQMTKNDYVIITGDFGFVWDNSKEDIWWRNWLDNKPFTTLFIDGNHENFDLLETYPIEEKFGGKVRKITDSIFYLCRGQIFDIQGKRFFTMGGAECHDKEYRTYGKSMWVQELPNDDEYEEARKNLEKCGWKVDIVLTHCAPTSVQNIILGQNIDFYSANKLTDFLDEISKKLDFKHWYTGHYHFDKTLDEDKRFRVLFNNLVRADNKE